MGQSFEDIGNFVQQDWVLTLFTAVVILIITAIVARLVSTFIKRTLRQDTVDLPSASIFVNIGRALVWITGISILLATCFDINVSAIIAALGVGGIAISLGLQDTIANLIGGLQLTLAKIINPGDEVKVSDVEGTVKDISWRHTTIITKDGNETVIPNAVINKAALTYIKHASSDSSEN